MSKHREKLVQTYLRRLADRMGLKDWDITYVPDTEAEGDAEIRTTENQHARVFLHPRFWDEPPEYQRMVCVHELAHLPCSLFLNVSALVEKALPGSTGEVIKMAMDQAEEHAVQAFARLLAPTMPLPPKF